MGIDPGVSRLRGEIVSHNTTVHGYGRILNIVIFIIIIIVCLYSPCGQ